MLTRDNPTQQCKDTDNPDCSPEDTHCILCLQIVGETIPYPYGALIRGVKAVIGGNSLAVFFFKGFVTFYAVQVLGCKDDVIQLVSFIIDGLQGGEGDIRFVCLAVSLVIVEAYYLIGHSTGIDKLSDGFSMRFPKRISADFLWRMMTLRRSFRSL